MTPAIPDEAVQAAHAEYHKVLGDSNRSNPMLAALTAALPFLQGVNVKDAPNLTRPLIGIENRTAQEVFDIMCDRILSAIETGITVSAPSPRAQALEEIRAIAEKQKAYWFEKQKSVKALEEAYSEDGEDYTPLGDHEAWKSGSANGHYSEADWFLKTIESLLSHLAPIHADNAHGRPLEEEEFAIDKLRFRAFHTNSDADRQTYFDAVSKWFQDRHYRRMDAERALSSQPVADGVNTIEVTPSSGCVFADMGVERPVADGWLPIETAPKDGTWVMLFYNKMCVPIISFYDEERLGWSCKHTLGSNTPTHWRPHPASPEATRPTGGSNHGE